MTIFDFNIKYFSRTESFFRPVQKSFYRSIYPGGMARDPACVLQIDQDNHDGRDDHDERQRPLPRPLKEVQRRENRNLLKKSVPENDLIYKDIFLRAKMFCEIHVFDSKTRSDYSWSIIWSIFIKKLHRIAFLC